MSCVELASCCLCHGSKTQDRARPGHSAAYSLRCAIVVLWPCVPHATVSSFVHNYGDNESDDGHSNYEHYLFSFLIPFLFFLILLFRLFLFPYYSSARKHMFERKMGLVHRSRWSAHVLSTLFSFLHPVAATLGERGSFFFSFFLPEQGLRCLPRRYEPCS